jgi:HEAT repeat protein
VDGLTHFCWHCYAENGRERGPCSTCGRLIEAPATTTYVDCLLWALRHPVAERRLIAAHVLGRLGERRASAPLRELALSRDDPVLAAEALRNLVAIDGAEELAPLLSHLATGGAAGVRRVAQEAQARKPHAAAIAPLPLRAAR